MKDQNKHLLIQTSLAALIVLFTYAIGWNYFYFVEFKFFGLLFMILIGPVIALSQLRLFLNRPLGELGKVFRILAWSSFILLALLLFLDSYYFHKDASVWVLIYANIRFMFDSFYWPYYITFALLLGAIYQSKKAVCSTKDI